MKISYKKEIIKLAFLAFIFSFQLSRAQCSLNVPLGVIAPTSGTAFTTFSNYGPGYYFQFPMLNGGSYAISTCGASIDTQITGWNSVGTSTLFFNDDNGALCTGNTASIDNYVPSFTGYVNVQVSQSNCQPGGSASINVLVRQNNNLAFTSSSAAMCSGQTRNLTATPANVGSTPGGFGNPGTFSGAGVSGNVFTAPVVASPTSYTITYTFGYVSQTQTVTVNPNPTVAVNSGTICSGNSFTMVPSGASTYTIQGGNPIVSPLSNTNYTVIGTSAAGCLSSNTATSNITVNTTPTISVNSGSICSGSPFTLTPSGASTYTIQGGSNIVSPTITTNYTVTGTSALGCIGANTATSNVTVNANPTVSVNSGTICSGNSFTIVPSGAITYTIQGGLSVVSPSSNTTYTVKGTNAAGCVSANTATSNVTVNPTPLIDLNGPIAGTNLVDNICAGTSYTLVQNGVNTYSIIGFGSLVLSPSINTTYTVISTSSLGCVSSNSANLFLNVTPSPTLSVNSGAICSGNSFTIVPSGAITYTYSGGSSIVSPTVTTSYSVTGTNAQGCVSSTAAVSSVTVNANPIITVNSGAICSGNSFTIVPSGASTYTYSGGSSIVSPTINTSYNVTGTSAQGCNGATAISNVTVNSLPTVTAVSNLSLICVGQSATLTSSGATTYTWNTGGISSTEVVSPTVTTSYTVNGTNANGCSNMATITQSVSTCTGISKVTEAFETTINVYPNPSSGIYTFDLINSSNITIVDLLGKVVYTAKLQEGKNSVNLTNLNNGLYILKAESNGVIKTVRLVKE
jgi:hypothetical protein